MSELKFSKRRQLSGGVIREVSTKEKDRRFKALLICIYESINHVVLASSVDVHHIQGKKAHPELRYAPSNCILLTRKEHIEAHRQGKTWKEPRSQEEVARLTYFDCLFI